MTFENVAFDLDGLPEPPEQAVKAKDGKAKSGASWTRYKAQKTVHCDTCLAEVHRQWPYGGTHAPNPAVFKRVAGGEATFLCAEHGTDLRSKDEAAKPKKKKGRK